VQQGGRSATVNDLSPKMLLQCGTIQTDRPADLKVHRQELATSNVYAWTYTEMFDYTINDRIYYISSQNQQK